MHGKPQVDDQYDDSATEVAVNDVKSRLIRIGMQFVKFGAVGVTNTVLSYVIYAVLVYFSIHYLIASIISFIVGVFWSFYWNSRLVFKLEEGKNRNQAQSLAKTFVSYAFTGLILANFLLVIEVDVFGLNAYLAPLINLFVTVPLNFFLNRNWAFKSKG